MEQWKNKIVKQILNYVYLRKKNLRKRNQKIAFKINGEFQKKNHICPFTINKNRASIVIASQLWLWESW